jgi:hypothetical protein
MPTIRSTGLWSVCLTMAFVFCADVWAGEAWHIAERGGFLLGHGYRCGAPVERLEAPAKLIHDLIDAAAITPDEKASADQAFAEQLLVSLITPGAGDLLPSCPRVRRELARMKQHQPATANPGVSVDAQRTHAQTRPAKADATFETTRAQARKGQRGRHD